MGSNTQDQPKPKEQAASVKPSSQALIIGNEIKQILIGTPIEKDAMVIAAMYQSGFFRDVKSLSQAITKALLGNQMGLNVVQAINGINVIEGRIAMDSHTIREKVQEAGYEIQTVESTDKKCVLKWLKDGQELGITQFTWEDAERAGLTYKDNWKKWPGDMLYARATTQGARRFAVKAFGGQAVYDRDEFADERTTVAVNGKVTDDMVNQVLNQKASEKDNNGKAVVGEVVEEKSNGKPKASKKARQ